jgi:hypothetical protein
MKTPTRFRTLDCDVLLVPARDVVWRPDEAAARHLVRSALEGPERSELWRLAEHLSSAPVGSDDDVVRVVAGALSSGVLVPVRIEREPMVLDEAQATMLSDLVEPAPRTSHQMPEPETTWISFDVWDDAGAAVDAGFRASAGGQSQSGRSDRAKIRFTELPVGSEMVLELDGVVLPNRSR